MSTGYTQLHTLCHPHTLHHTCLFWPGCQLESDSCRTFRWNVMKRERGSLPCGCSPSTAGVYVCVWVSLAAGSVYFMKWLKANTSRFSADNHELSSYLHEVDLILLLALKMCLWISRQDSSLHGICVCELLKYITHDAPLGVGCFCLCDVILYMQAYKYLHYWTNKAHGWIWVQF